MAATRYGYAWDPQDDRYEYGSRTELDAAIFDAALTVQLWTGGGRIRLPKSLIPPIHSRGTERWWNFENVVSGPNQITARYRLNGLNRPRVTIERRSGRISVVGAYSYAFRGTCDPIDARAHRRF